MQTSRFVFLLSTCLLLFFLLIKNSFSFFLTVKSGVAPQTKLRVQLLSSFKSFSCYKASVQTLYFSFIQVTGDRKYFNRNQLNGKMFLFLVFSFVLVKDVVFSLPLNGGEATKNSKLGMSKCYMTFYT